MKLPSSQGLRSSNRPVVAAVVLAILTLAMFADVLFDGTGTILSRAGTDLSSQFIGWREFGFGQLRQGHLALWNPHLFSGAPYLGGFQSALLYPLNWLYLVLAMGPAVNWSIALHVFLGGLFVDLWTSRRRLHPVACLAAATIFMFGGATFLHVYAGHLPNICAIAWVPPLLLAIDGFLDSASPAWLLLGAGALAMEVLAGHPQYVFYTIVMSGLYTIACAIRRERRLVLLAGVAAMFALGLAFAAVQLLTGLDASAESVRSIGVSYAFAAKFSFPPENLLTLAVPGFFGDTIRQSYWGRCYLWEMSLFVGASGLVLAVYGAVRGDRTTRRYSLLMTLVAFTLALGAHTPLFEVLYRWIPGFDALRGSSKFTALAALFISMLSAIGLDRLMRPGSGGWKAAWPITLAACVAGAAGWMIAHAVDQAAPAAWWSDILQNILATRESYLSPGVYQDPAFVAQAGRFAATGLWIAGGTWLLASALVWGANRRRWPAYALAALVVVELFTFARINRPTFNLASVRQPDVDQFLREHTGTSRILNLADPNSAMSTGAFDAWGYDPGVPLRYAQFIAWTQGASPDAASQNVQFNRGHQLFDMLRIHYILYPLEGGLQVQEVGDPMAQVQLVRQCRVVAQRDAIFSAMSAPDFDPRRTVILESPPDPAPAASGSASDTARVVEQSTDDLTIEADLSAPAILLVTDGYSRGWRAVPLPDSSQQRYEVMPANYVLRAVPLRAGHHHFRMAYRPAAFVAGTWISLVSLGAGLVMAVVCLRRRRRASPLAS